MSFKLYAYFSSYVLSKVLSKLLWVRLGLLFGRGVLFVITPSSSCFGWKVRIRKLKYVPKGIGGYAKH